MTTGNGIDAAEHLEWAQGVGRDVALKFGFRPGSQEHEDVRAFAALRLVIECRQFDPARGAGRDRTPAQAFRAFAFLRIRRKCVGEAFRMRNGGLFYERGSNNHKEVLRACALPTPVADGVPGQAGAGLDGDGRRRPPPGPLEALIAREEASDLARLLTPAMLLALALSLELPRGSNRTGGKPTPEQQAVMAERQFWCRLLSENGLPRRKIAALLGFCKSMVDIALGGAPKRSPALSARESQRRSERRRARRAAGAGDELLTAEGGACQRN